MKKASLILLIVTLLFAAFTGGFFLGKNFSGGRLTVSNPPTTSTPTTAFPSDSSVDSPSIPSEPKVENTCLLNINTATQAELSSLPGIGDVLAQRIIAYRQENGPFQSIYELMEVSGIGEKKMNAIEELITTGG